MLQTSPSPHLDTEPSLCSLILSHCNSNNLQESLWRERVAELGVNCSSVTDTDKSFQPHLRWLNYFGKDTWASLTRCCKGKLPRFYILKKKKKALLLHELHLHLISVGLLWRRPQRTPVGQKEINLQLQRRSLWMPEGKLVLMQNNMKAGQSEAHWSKW